MHCGGKQKYLCVTQVQLQRNPRCSIIPQPPAWLCCSLLWQLLHTSRRPGLDLHLQIQGKDSRNRIRRCCRTDWQKHPEKGKMGRKGQRHLQQSLVAQPSQTRRSVCSSKPLCIAFRLWFSPSRQVPLPTEATRPFWALHRCCFLGRWAAACSEHSPSARKG